MYCLFKNEIHKIIRVSKRKSKNRNDEIQTRAGVMGAGVPEEKGLGDPLGLSREGGEERMTGGVTWRCDSPRSGIQRKRKRMSSIWSVSGLRDLQRIQPRGVDQDLVGHVHLAQRRGSGWGRGFGSHGPWVAW